MPSTPTSSVADARAKPCRETVQARAGALSDFLAVSPLPGSALAVERSKDRPRDMEL